MMSLPGAFDQLLNKSGAKTLGSVLLKVPLCQKVGTKYTLFFIHWQWYQGTFGQYLFICSSFGSKEFCFSMNSMNFNLLSSVALDSACINQFRFVLRYDKFYYQDDFFWLFGQSAKKLSFQFWCI